MVREEQKEDQGKLLIQEPTNPTLITEDQVASAANSLHQAVEEHQRETTAKLLVTVQEHEDLITECAREYAALDKETTGPRQIITKQFDEEAEMKRLVKTYEEIEMGVSH